MANDVEKEESIGPLTLRFKHGIKPDGKITGVTLEQFESCIQLTKEQAISLADTLSRKFET